MSLEGNISDTQATRIKEFIKQGMNLKQEVADINESLKDLAKTIGDEVSVKPAVLMKALNMACKGAEKAEDERENFSSVEEILALCNII